MAALTKDRNTRRMNDEAVSSLVNVPVKAAKLLYKGGIVAMLNGYAEPGETATGLQVAGIAEAHADNSAGLDGAITCRVRRGTFKLDNSGGDPVLAAGVFKVCYLVDDHTVSQTDGGATQSVAGLVVQLDSDGVWVELGNYAQKLV